MAAQKPAIIFIHGWGADERMFAYAAENFEADGYIVHRFNLPGHGTMPGNRQKLTRADYLQAALAEYDRVARRPDVDPTQITVVGLSLGSYLAMLLSVERPAIKRLILITPATYPDEDFATEPLSNLISDRARHKELVRWRQHTANCTDHKAAAALCAFKGDVLIVAGETDGNVPLSGLAALAEVSQKPLRVLNAVGHVPSAAERYRVVRAVVSP